MITDALIIINRPRDAEKALDDFITRFCEHYALDDGLLELRCPDKRMVWLPRYLIPDFFRALETDRSGPLFTIETIGTGLQH
jgi:hypothetical protein